MKSIYLIYVVQIYVKRENISPVLKQKHQNGNFSEIILAMLVFHPVTLRIDFNGLLIIRTDT